MQDDFFIVDPPARAKCSSFGHNLHFISDLFTKSKNSSYPFLEVYCLQGRKLGGGRSGNGSGPLTILKVELVSLYFVRI